MSDRWCDSERPVWFWPFRRQRIRHAAHICGYRINPGDPHTVSNGEHWDCWCYACDKKWPQETFRRGCEGG